MLEIIIDTSNKCFMGCKYCGTNSYAEGNSFLSSHIIKKVITDIADYSNENIIFLGGGSFFCHPNWREILLLNKKICSNIIIDCPLYLDFKNIILQYQPNNYHYQISLSLWGIGETHNILTDRKSYYLIDDFINILIKNQARLRISFVITKEFISQFDEIIRFINSLPESSIIYFHRLMPAGRCTVQNIPTPSEIKQFCDAIKNSVSNFVELRFHHTINQGICMAFKNRIFINHDNNIYRCGWLNSTSMSIGSIMTYDEDVYYTSTYRKQTFPYTISEILKDVITETNFSNRVCLLPTNN